MNATRLFVYAALMVLFACSNGKQKAKPPAEPGVSEAAQPGTPAAEPTSTEPAAKPDPATTKQQAFPPADEYVIDGNDVGREEFDALRAELEIAPEPESSAEIVNKDGAYGGDEATFRAVHKQSGAVYSFIEVTFVEGDKRRTRLTIQTR